MLKARLKRIKLEASAKMTPTPPKIDIPQMTETQKQSQAIVFGELLHEILHYIPTRDLIQCRCVNRAWSFTAQKVLLQRPDHLITFRYNPHLGTYILKDFRRTSDQSLRSFTLMATKWLTPCPLYRPPPLCVRFGFLGGNLDCPDSQIFFSLLGPSIKCLSLDLWDYAHPTPSSPEHATSLATLDRILSTQLPSGHLVVIKSFPTIWWNIKQTSGFLDGDLPNLIELDISAVCNMTTPILQKLLTAAVNLKSTNFRRIDIPSNCLMNVLTNVTSPLHRIHTKDVTIRSLPELEELEIVQKFADYNLKLEHLHFTLSYRRRQESKTPPSLSLSQIAKAEAALLKIFTNSQESLKVARFGPTAFVLLNKLENVGQLPTFPRVTSFILDGHHGHTEVLTRVGKQWFKISHLFPNLVEVRIDLDDSWPLASYCPPFTEDDQIGSVKKLTIHCHANPRSFSKDLHLLFPNVKVMILLAVKHFPGIARHVWQFKKLVKLEFNLELNSAAFPHLDVAFTGFSKETVSGISNGMIKVGRNPGKLREGPSIVDLKDLECMEISFDDWNPAQKSSYNFLTQVSGKFAFKLMPKLQVKFLVEDWALRNSDNLAVLKESLKPLTSLPNVKIQEENYED